MQIIIPYKIRHKNVNKRLKNRNKKLKNRSKLNKIADQIKNNPTRKLIRSCNKNVVLLKYKITD